jgi:hypothetical protein
VRWAAVERIREPHQERAAVEQLADFGELGLGLAAALDVGAQTRDVGDDPILRME